MIHPGRYSSLGELLADAFVQFKTDPALVEVDREDEVRRLTYREVARRVCAVRGELHRRGIGPDDRVAFLGANQSAWLIAAAAVLQQGAVLVPLDPKLTPSEHDALLQHARPKLLFADEEIARRLTVPTSVVELSSVHELPEGLAPDAPEVRGRGDLATIVYSSGTGGRPKGCQLGHGAYLSQLEGLLELFPMARGDRTFSILPTNHAIDFLCGFIGPFCCGGTVIHQRTLRPKYLRDTMARYRITHMAVVPMVLTAFERSVREQIDTLPAWKRSAVDALVGLNEALTSSQPRPAISRRLLRPIHDAFGGALQVLFCGGAFVPRETAEFFRRLGIPVVIGYGLTEATTVATVHRLGSGRCDGVGAPVPGVEIRIDRPDPDGVGEVWIRGPTLMRGYLDDPELTAEVLSDGWLKTGDLGWLDASYHLHLVGRTRNLIVTPGGKNIYPEDIEGAFAGVPCDELAVFAADWIWPRRGLIGEQLVAVVRGQSDLALAAALEQRNHRLPDFKRISGYLCWPEEFPKTATLKLKRKELAEAIRKQVDRDQVVSL